MNRTFACEKGFTLTEVMFAAVITALIIGIIMSAWLFAYRTWIENSGRTELRMDIMTALETMKDDLRYSSLTYVSFYPSTGPPYTAISFPVAEPDENGLFNLDDDGYVDWDETICYHIYTGEGGDEALRRTVIPITGGIEKDDDVRYNQLKSVVENGTGGGGSSTDTDFLVNLDIFEITPEAPVFDFYDESSDPVKVGKVIFGWVKCESGEHDIKFQITGQNDGSTGYGIGIDNLMIEPCGSEREAEYYNSSFAPSGSLTVSGGTASRVNDILWSQDNYLEFDLSGVDDFVTFTDDYDLWRESSFSRVSLDNTEMVEEEVRVSLDVPDEGEEGRFSWYPHVETGDLAPDGTDEDLPGSTPVTVRTVLTADNIAVQGDLVRVRFSSSSENPLKIGPAYITRRYSGEDGLENVSTSGKDIEEYHMHQQLFFKDTYDVDDDSDTDEIVEATFIPEDSSVWSVWTAYPLINDDSGSPVDHLITFFVPDLSSITSWPSGWSFSDSLEDSRYWDGTSTHSYYLSSADYSTNDLQQAAGTPVWNAGGTGSYTTVNSSNDIFVSSTVDTWKIVGTAESQIFDTGLSAPEYNQIKWSENAPSGTEINLKVRSSQYTTMSDASDWDDITGTTTNPDDLNISNVRYVQFLAELSATPFWEAPQPDTKSYSDYVDAQRLLSACEFPEDTSGDPYITGLYSTWVDNVEIDWPGDERICTITGYVAKKNDYGQAQVTFDGKELSKILSLYVKISKQMHGRTITEENYVEIEPRNTGK